MKLRYLLLAGGVTFAAALLLQAPAALLYAWTLAARSDAPVRLYGVEGTLLSGRALQVSQGSQALLRQLRWTFRPQDLLLGRVGYHLRSDAPPMLVDGVLATGIGGLQVTRAQASGELRALAGAFGQGFVPVNGQVGLQLERLRLAGGWPVAAQGEVRIAGLAWVLGREPVPLGDYRAELTTDAGEIVATVGSLGGALEVSGSGRVRPDRSYELDLRLRPGADAAPMLTNLLRQLGAPDAQGYYRLRQSTAAAPAPADVGAAPVAAPGPAGPQPASPVPGRTGMDLQSEGGATIGPAPADDSGVTFGGGE
ncbi:type II secretion system protein N [Fontimonas sp. SYSU GA230001]|uniref:type II secretion system protein N n=1 Tax=Fontimonas sp. SYSU GA230001 TaxID=3142450 RepID=UPI0032B58D34